MDDPLNNPESQPFEQGRESASAPESVPVDAIDDAPNEAPDETSDDASEYVAEKVTYVVIPSEARNPSAELVPTVQPQFASIPATIAQADAASWRRNFRHNILLLLSLTLAAFILTAWILVRVDSPFGIYSSGPQEIVRAQLRALDRGDLRPAYNMFSARYRGQVSFENWHELIVTHWRMFHAQVLHSGTPANAGPSVTLEIYLHAADDKDYRARFTLVRGEGRWWIDDVHWAEEPDHRDLSRT